MFEGEPGKSKEPTKTKIIRQRKKPKAKPGIKYIPVRDNPSKISLITGWMAVSTKPAFESPPEWDELSKEPSELPQKSTDKLGSAALEQRKESLGKGYTPTSISRKKRDYPTFIDRSQPTGDKD